MPDSIYHFGCTFAVRKSAQSILTDMELAQRVHAYLRYVAEHRAFDGNFYIVSESIHPIMVGPEGGTPAEDE